MAASLLSPLSAPNTGVGLSISLPKSSSLSNPSLFVAPSSSSFSTASVRNPARRCYCCKPPSAKSSSDHIPKQFRQENLKDGLMDNFKNVPEYFYGLSPSQMNMFMTADNPVRRQSERVTEESISSAKNYLNHGGMWNPADMEDNSPSKYSMSVSMYRGGARGNGRPTTAPPDLPSLLLDARICYLGMPITQEVTELLVAQFMWLDYDNPTKPIYLYINSSGTQNEKLETVGTEGDAYCIADTMGYCKSDVYTVNCGMAYGQAAMLLSLGTKGFRAVQPNSSTKLYLPKVSRSSGPVIDMWIKAKELEASAEYYVELLEQGTGRPKEEIRNDIQRPKYFQAKEAIDYGLADKILDSQDKVFERRDYEQMLAQSNAMQRAAGVGPQAAPSGFT